MAVLCVHDVDLVTTVCNECFPDPHACSFNRLPEFHPIPDEIDATVVASYECPACRLIMVREHLEVPTIKVTTYHCCNPDCELNQISYYAPQIHMRRVGAAKKGPSRTETW